MKRSLGGTETQHMRKWQRLFVNCFEGKKLIFTKREFLNSGKMGQTHQVVLGSDERWRTRV
jgi:hypothetical protein